MKEAQELLVKEESAKIVNDADIHSEAIRLAESSELFLSMRLIKSPLKPTKFGRSLS